MAIRSLVAACLCWSAIAAGQTSAAAKTYDVKDAYQIYSLLLSHEELFNFAKGPLIIQAETEESKGDLSEPCVTPEAASRFKDAIADYKRVNKKQWLLQRQFQIEKPYGIVSSETIGIRYPESDGLRNLAETTGYIIMSAVGFNREKTLAVVYYGSFCGSLCGSWRFHPIAKIDGNWKEVPGVPCETIS